VNHSLKARETANKPSRTNHKLFTPSLRNPANPNTAIRSKIQKNHSAASFSRPTSQGGEIALRTALGAPERIAALVLVESSGFPPAGAGVGFPVLQVAGDHLDATPLWVDLAARYRAFAAELTRQGTRNDAWFLAERGVRGNSHMPMLDDNSAEIARETGAWLRAI
jgi:hypothetical protein